MTKQKGFTLVELLAWLASSTVLSLMIWSTLSWAKKSYVNVETQQGLSDLKSDLRVLFKDRFQCLQNFEQSGVTISSTAGAKANLDSIRKFNPDKSLEATITSLANSNLPNLPIDKIYVETLAESTAGTVQVSLAIEFKNAEVISRPIKLPLLVKKDGSGNITDCSSLEKDGEIDLKYICASAKLKYDPATQSCKAPTIILVHEYGTSVTCPADYTVQSCYALGYGSGYQYKYAPFVLPDGTIEMREIVPQFPYSTDTSNPQKCIFNYYAEVDPAFIPNWDTYAYCKPNSY